MYICICNPTTDAEVRAACSQVSSHKELKNKLSICNTCGRCSQEVESIFQDALNSSARQTQ